MSKLMPDDLAKIAERMRRTASLRGGSARAKMTVHMGTCGISAGAREVMSALMKAMDERGVKDVALTTSGCAGLCSQEPMLTVEVKGDPPVKYVEMTSEKAVKVFSEHVLGGKLVAEFALGEGSERLP